MRYLGVDRWSTGDYDIGCAVFRALQETPLPEQIKRSETEISFNCNRKNFEDRRIIYHAQNSYGKWDERDSIWVYIEEPKTRDTIFDAVSSVLEKRAYYKAEKEAEKKMKIAIMKQELQSEGLDFLDGIEEYINAKEKRR